MWGLGVYFFKWLKCKKCISEKVSWFCLKHTTGTVMQVEKALINACLRVSKLSWKFHIPTNYNFAVFYPWNLLFSLKRAYFCTAWKVSKYGGFFWSVISCIWTEYGDLRSKSSYSVCIQENTDQKKLCISTLFTQCLTVSVVFFVYKQNFKAQ